MRGVDIRAFHPHPNPLPQGRGSWIPACAGMTGREFGVLHFPTVRDQENDDGY